MAKIDHVWITPGKRTVSWTESAQVAIGRHRCAWCPTVTPEPSDSDVVNWLDGRDDRRTIWPFDGWDPPGWTNENDILCPACSEAKQAAVATARSARTGGDAVLKKPPPTLRALRQFQDAVALLLADETRDARDVVGDIQRALETL